jgi:hypothetical protein
LKAVRLCEICGGQSGTGFSPHTLGFHCQYRFASALFFTRVLVPEDLGTLKQSGASSDIGEQWPRKKAPSLFVSYTKKLVGFHC